MTHRFIFAHTRNRSAALATLAATTLLLSACASNSKKVDRPDNPFNPGSDGPGAARAPASDEQLRREAAVAYYAAREQLDSGDYETADQRYQALITRYPFTDFATQAELEKIYAEYRSFKQDEAVTAADRFLREHPRHPHADYVQYVKGLADYSRDSSFTDFLPIDKNKRDPLNARRAYDDFAIILQKYPQSIYANDSRQRMLFLRNKIAAHELTVVQYYVKRGAWVAAAKRAENIIAEYPGAPATADALKILEQCYSNLGQKSQADEARQLIAANSASLQAAHATKTAKPATVQYVNADGSLSTASPQQAADGKPKSLLQRVGGFVDNLNKSYTVGNVTQSETDPSAPNSLATGPYSGSDTVINVAPPTVTTAPDAAQPAGAAGEPKKAEKRGWFDFLNKTYTIGGKKDAAAAPAEAVPTATAAPVAAPAAVAPTTAVPTTAAPVTTTVPAEAPAAAATAPEEKKKGGWFNLNFLNKTYTVGGKKDAAAPASTAPAADGSQPAPAKANAAPEKKGILDSIGDVLNGEKTFTIHTKDGGAVAPRTEEERNNGAVAKPTNNTGLHVTLDYGDKDEANQDGDKSTKKSDGDASKTETQPAK